MIARLSHGCWALAAAMLLSVFWGCIGSKEVERLPDEQFGHRYEEEGPEGRRTIIISPADSAESYFYYPAVFDTVTVRPALFGTQAEMDGAVPVEILVKGAIPDGCTQLHDVSQERSGHIIEVDFQMRRPQGAVCTQVRRPYRFYLQLAGTYSPGNYTLKLNDRAIPFTVRRQAG